VNDLLLKALACENHGNRPPVWLMRQAGRYMPEYRELRKRHSLHHLFHTPELAAEITLQPIRRFDVDAAIVFSDILVVVEMLGLTVQFPEGKSPYIQGFTEDVDQLLLRPARDVLSYVRATIELVRPQLSVPLIGFCGGPYTVASYLIGRENITQWVENHPQKLHRLLEKILEATLEYLHLQIEAGVHVVQIFDSWAGLLPAELFSELSLRYLERMVQTISVPSILFMRGSCDYAKELAQIRPTAISFDSQKEMALLRREIPKGIAVQGNLAPESLLGSKDSVKESTRALLSSMQKDPGFIVNLGHGVLPATPEENVEALIEVVKQSPFC